MSRRRFPLIVRLARIDRELSNAAEMLSMVGEDVIEALVRVREVEQRVVLLVAVAGSMLMVCGIDRSLVHEWMTEMGPDGDIEDADLLGAQIIQQVLLTFGPTQGEG
jgi:hypothetical protein